MRGAARLGDRTPSQDLIIVSRPSTVQIDHRPAAVVGDMVVGPVITGVVTMGSGTVIIDYCPAARFLSEVTGTSTPTGAPMSSFLAFTSTDVYIGD